MQHCRFRLPFTLFCLLLAVPSIGFAQQAETRDAPRTPVERLLPYLPFEPLRVPSFTLQPYEALFVSRPFPTWIREWTEATRLALENGERNGLRRLRAGAPAAEPIALVEEVPQPQPNVPAAAQAADTVAFLPPLIERTPRRDSNPLGGMVGEHADLGIRVVGNGSIGGAWTRYRPCDPGVQFNCNPNLFPQLKPDVEFGIRVGGTISERVHVDVDYDQAREFDAANNINVYYQGLPDEVLQRAEVGDVSIRLPSSRYMTRGVPAGNFGFMATGQLGPLDFQTVFAQQKGDLTTREFKLGGGGTAGLVQDATLVLDDADYVKGQFFFLVPPSDIAGQPHIDALALRPTDAPVSVRPAFGGSIELYRDERLAGGQNAQVGYFLADAVPPGGGARHTGSFRRLLQDQDYIVHSSGLWLMLRSPLRADEALAVSFVTEAGDTVGRMNAEATPAGVTPRLRLLRGPVPTHQPGSATWDLELHQVYRLDSSTDVDLNTVELTVSLGERSGGRTFRDVLGQQLSFLRFFGLDEDSPTDRLDPAQVFQPARETFGSGTSAPIGGTYVIFPTLRPFAAPAPLASVRLSAADLAAALGNDANNAIYFDPDPVNRAAAARFRLNFNYRVQVEGLVTSFNLGAFGIRENSERLTLGTRTLMRDVDYTIDYEVGVVTLLDAQTLFALNPNAEIRAAWEQKPLFSIAPTSVFGASARYRVGTRGELNFVGLFQSEKSLMTRPELGMEPGSGFLGGVSGSFQLGGALLDRMLSSVPRLRGNRPSGISLTGEVAFSLPNPNRFGAAYLDDFEGTDEVGLSVRRQDWKLGSMPQSSEADRGTLPFVLDAASAAPLVWQHDFINDDGRIGGSLGPRSQIDRQINLIGNELPEPVMWLTFGRPAAQQSPLPPPPDDRRWRSITTVLSTTGRDMSRSEYLEFYVAAGFERPMALIFDIGTVGEDAFYVDSLGQTTGTFDDGTRWGIGTLDQEASLIDREVWGRDRDERGIWNQPCRAEPLVSYPLGDARANCSRGNGVQDTEDLNGNGVLDDEDGQYFRYVVQLDQMSEYLVRDTTMTGGTGFRLYRIPLRGGTAINGANDGTWRFIRHLRLTVAGEPQGVRVLSIARMRIVGSRWTKRDIQGIQRGRLEAEPGTAGEVRVGPVSRLTDGAVYRPPPGVQDAAQDPTSQFGGGGVEINEKSLRVRYTDLQPGERAEVYFRYPQQPRNFLMYREMRLWILPREGRWGEDGDQEFILRIGTDPRNFYIYRSRLRPPTGPRAVVPGDWVPEVVIDFTRWMELKAAAERLLIERGPKAAGQDTVWSADSTYAIVLEDRARAPNLAAVRELGFAVYNGGAFAADGEVWIDELRVHGPDTDRGAAGNIALDVVAGDFVNASFSVANQGALFRQLNETPSFVGGADLNMVADARLDRLLPPGWGIDLPLSVSHTRNAQNPMFLQQSDVLADRLDGLREAGAEATRIGVRLSKRTPTANPLVSLLVDGAALRLSYNTSHNQSITARSESGGFMGDVAWRRDLVPRVMPALPAFVVAALRALAPEPLENSDVFRRLTGSRLRWSPATLSFGSLYNDQLSRSFRYDRILALPGDSAQQAIESPRQSLRNDVQLGLRPFQSLTANVTLASDRDVLAPERASTQPLERRALEAARTSIAGMDVGWETARVINSTLNYRPELTRWLRAGYTYNNRYLTDRNPSYLELDVAGADTAATLQRRFESSRQTSRTLQLQPGGLVGALRLDSAGLTGRALRGVHVIDVTWRSALTSQFERESFVPGFGYQLGFGDMAGFRVIGADTAVRAQQRDEFRASSTLQLPLGTRLDVGYHTADVESFDQRGGTRFQHEVGWPKATLQWSELRIPGVLKSVITNVSASFGLERIERTATLGGPNPQMRGGTELRMPLGLQIGMRRGFNVLYRGSFSAGETLDPTGNAESGGYQHDLTLSGVMQPPSAWREKLNGPITLQLSYTDQQQQQCRYHGALIDTSGCIAFLDVGSSALNLRIESMISDISVGVLLNYVDRQNAVGTRTGTSQFNLSLYGRFNFNAGEMPARYR